MALIKCSDCGTEVSDAAPACPKCGRPITSAPMYASPRKPPPLKSKGNASGGFAILVLVALSVWIYNKATAPSDSVVQSQTVAATSNAELAPANLAQRIGTIHNVVTSEPPSIENGEQFLVTVKADSIFQGGETAEDVLHTVHNHVGPAIYAGVSVQLVVALVDGYGRSSQEPLLQLAYAPDDVRKIAFENITTFDILNLARVSALNPSASNIVSDECASTDSLAKYAGAFCVAAATAPLSGTSP